MSSEERKNLYLAGIGVSHSIAPPMHNHISASLSLPSTFTNVECPTVESVMELFRAPSFAGGVVTMPYKQSIMSHLDELDPLCTMLGACNNVYLTPQGKLRGTNTDWRGIKGCLLEGEKSAGKVGQGRGKPALIIGAGGASRAAVYAVCVELGCAEVYIVNRDEGEVNALLADTKAYTSTSSPSPGLTSQAPKIRHVTSVTQASELATPFYVVGTVPDFEPQAPSELLCRDILISFLDRDEKGVLLDMCFKPRNTRILKMGREKGWSVVDGTGVIGHQIKEQWRLWAGAGEEGRKQVPQEEAWEILRREAESSRAINF